MLKDVKNKTRRCPFCAELIQAAAVKCRFCSEFLVAKDHLSAQGKLFDDHYDEEIEDEYEVDEEEYEDEYEDEEELEDQEEEEEEEDESEIEEEDPVLYRGSPSMFASTKIYFRAGLIIGIAVLLYKLPLEDYIHNFSYKKFEFSKEQYIMFMSYRVIVSACIGLLGIIYLLGKILSLKCINYEVTADRIEWSRGIFGRKIDNVDMFRVVDLRLHRTFVDCLIGIGTVRLFTRDKTDNEFDFYKVRRPRKLYNIMKKASLDADARQNVVHLE